MNTVKSFWLGWGSLCVAGAGAYVVAKRSINAERQARLEEQMKKKSMIESLENSANMNSSFSSTPNARNGNGPNMDPVGSPSREENDPAPTRHAPTTEGERVLEKSKYESSTPFRSKKGDRFSDM
ncbi:hypothetical protein BD289DRAFT_423319 [Coniella lustricola]|uniref:Uncharacterized protein n=1 Tax=Coniella lustricola TaxID=2025994 RepID=A0A2T3AJN2_9PEZI|nr:hypothetical protein BD289DRAFT_423319 [Coniella lustricola]